MITLNRANLRQSEREAIAAAEKMLIGLGHSLTDWEGTSPGFHLVACTACPKCQTCYLGEFSTVNGMLNALPSSRMQQSPCPFPEWITAPVVLEILKIKAKHLRDWLELENIEAKTFAIRWGLPSSEATVRKQRQVVAIRKADVEALKERIVRKVDKIGRERISLMPPPNTPEREAYQQAELKKIKDALTPKKPGRKKAD